VRWAKTPIEADFVEFDQAKLDEFDEAKRKVERLFRDALADGLIDAWVNGTQGMEKLSDRESWRPMPVGLPGFEPRTHHLTNPGPNDEKEVFIEQGQQKTWIAMTATHQPTQPPTRSWTTRFARQPVRMG
jgi:hypothetical protein